VGEVRVNSCPNSVSVLGVGDIGLTRRKRSDPVSLLFLRFPVHANLVWYAVLLPLGSIFRRNYSP
jgi:hypothetical protein